MHVDNWPSVRPFINLETLVMGPLPSGPSREYKKHPPALQTQSKLFKTTQPLWSGPVSAGQLVPDDICQQGANLCTNSGKCIGDTEKLEAINLAFGLNILVLDVLVATHSGLPL